MKLKHLPAAPPLVLVALLISGGTGRVHAQEIDLRHVDAAIEDIRAEERIPGVALAIVHRDSVLKSGGYGVREVGRSEPVDENTFFAIGSATKAFTAVTTATLVDQGLIRWDDRVRDRLPGFVLENPFMTAEITIRDLLAHRSGLPPADLMWLTSSHPADTLLHRLRWIEPSAGFRSTFSYQNVLYLAAGRVLEKATGQKWEDLVAARVLAPLGMLRTNTSVRALSGDANFASPHAIVDDVVTPVPYRNIDSVKPAGSINSTASDLAQWLRFLLADGVIRGEQLVSAVSLRQTWIPQIVVPSDPVMHAFHPAARLQAYGLGWFVSDFHGRTLVAHGGGIDGMSALVAWIPEEELGVAILTNLQSSTPPVWLFGMLYSVLDPALGVAPTDWRTPAQELRKLFSNQAEPERKPNTRTSLPIGAYAGRYESRVLGKADVSVAEHRLAFSYGTLRGSLEHWHYDTFRVTWYDPVLRSAAGPAWITFRLNPSGTVQALELIVIPGETERLERRDRSE